MYCLHCRYNLRGLSDARCPECGAEFDPLDPRTFSIRASRVAPLARRALIAAAIVAILIVVLLIISFLPIWEATSQYSRWRTTYWNSNHCVTYD